MIANGISVLYCARAALSACIQRGSGTTSAPNILWSVFRMGASIRTTTAAVAIFPD